MIEEFSTTALKVVETYSAYLNTAAGGNEFLATSISLSLTAISGYLMFTLPKRFLSFIVKHITITVSVTSKDTIYGELMAALEKDGTLHKSRYHALTDTDIDTAYSLPTFGSGDQYIRILGILCKISSSQENMRDSVLYKLDITHFGRTPRIMSKIKNLIKHQDLKEDTFKIYDSANYNTTKLLRINYPLNTIEPETRKVYDRVMDFKNQAEKYEKYNIPFHLGVLLHGHPGTGKTRLIRKMISDLSADYKIIYGRTMENLVESITNNSVVVIEEVDSILMSRDNSPKKDSLGNSIKEFNLSKMLQVLDGVISYHNVIFILTTNKIEHIDAAMQRPGRLDIVHDIPFISNKVFTEFTKLYYDSEIDMSHRTMKPNITGALLQGSFTEKLSKHEFIEKFTEKNVAVNMRVEREWPSEDDNVRRQELSEPGHKVWGTQTLKPKFDNQDNQYTPNANIDQRETII
jgi:hypothetical protein